MGREFRERLVRDYLVFQLYGPLASWGDIAVGETRPSALTPSRSAILGLLAAALGLKRPDTAKSEPEREDWEQAHAALAQGYGLASRFPTTIPCRCPLQARGRTVQFFPRAGMSLYECPDMISTLSFPAVNTVRMPSPPALCGRAIALLLP